MTGTNHEPAALIPQAAANSGGEATDLGAIPLGGDGPPRGVCRADPLVAGYFTVPWYSKEKRLT